MMYLDGFRKQLIAWIREGLSDQEIADRVRVSRSTVRSWREQNGIDRPPRDGRTSRRPKGGGGKG